MKCNLCNEMNITADHNSNPKHLLNEKLKTYQMKRKTSDPKGMKIKCNIQSSRTNNNCSRVSASPKENIHLEFIAENENSNKTVVFKYVEVLSVHNNFKIQNGNEVDRNNCEVLIPARSQMETVRLTANFNEYGVYEAIIVFVFKITKEPKFFVYQDVSVHVEDDNTVSKEENCSVYTKKEIKAETFFKSPHRKSMFNFPVPPALKEIFANDLKTNRNTSPEDLLRISKFERIFEVGTTCKDNYVPYFQNLLWYEETVTKNKLKNFNMSGITIKQKKFKFSFEVPGLKDKRPAVIEGNVLLMKPTNNDDVMFEAIIDSIEYETITVTGLNLEFFKYYKVDELFDIRFLMSRIPMEAMHTALSCLNKKLFNRVYPVENNMNTKEPNIRLINDNIRNNTKQCLAVKKIISASSGTAPFLLHGPPGTGKTVTIVEAILQLAKSESNRIMVCADSNMSADYIAMMLVKYIEQDDSYQNPKNIIIRCNSRYRSWSNFPKCLKEYSNGTSRRTWKSLKVSKLLNYRIVVSTLIHTIKYRGKINTNYGITHLFIDEAAQASEPASLVPICGLLAPTGIVVLAGDPLQLGPVVSDRVKKIGLGESLMSRLKNSCKLYQSTNGSTLNPNYIVLLEESYRCHVDILYLPNILFYEGRLVSMAEEHPISYVNILEKRKKCRAVVFHGVMSAEQKMGQSPSYSNDVELKMVKLYVDSLLTDHGIKPNEIGVITPYMRQAARIERLFSTIPKFDEVEVGTVESFQGKEKLVVIVSTVRGKSDPLQNDAKLGFLVDPKKFNVILTRAKAKLIIIGNPLCLEKDSNWCAYMKMCQTLGTYYGISCQGLDAKIENIADRMNSLIV